MKKTLSLILLFSMIIITNSKGQNLVNVYSSDGKVFVLYDNGKSKEIASSGENSVVTFSRKKNLVIYKRLEHKSKTNEEGVESFDQYSVYAYDLNINQSRVLFMTCLDGFGGTKPDYAGSSIYPIDNLCGFSSAILSDDGERLYFETQVWAVCPAIHYYNLKENALVYFKAGWLQKVTEKGVEIQVTGIDVQKDRGEVSSGGRYTQYCLFDKQGGLIKELSPKEF